MNRKLLRGIVAALVFVAVSGIVLWAASGEVQEIALEIGEDGTVTVLVTLVDQSGETQTVRLSLSTAAQLGLLQVDEDGMPIFDENGNPIINDSMIGTIVEIDPGAIVESTEAAQHPVASALADFFADTLGLEYDQIMAHHEAGMGFGIIAQACWMALALDEDADAKLLGDILAAKKSGDYGSIRLPDGTTPENWGQLRKALLSNSPGEQNLGAIISEAAATQQMTAGNKTEKGKPPAGEKPRGRRNNRGGGKKQGK